LLDRSIEPFEVMWLDKSFTWMEPIVANLSNGVFPLDSKEAERVKKRAEWFILYDGKLSE